MIRQRSEYTSRLIEILSACEPGQKLTFQSLANKLGNPNCNITGYLVSARKYLLNHHHMEFLSLRGVGLKRAAHGELIKNSPLYLKSIRKKSSRGIKSLDCENMDELSSADRASHACYQAIFIAIRDEADLKQANKKVEIARIDAEERVKNLLAIKRG